VVSDLVTALLDFFQALVNTRLTAVVVAAALTTE
jgi:hypothetical protein